jgi:hypothetical protein
MPMRRLMIAALLLLGAAPAGAADRSFSANGFDKVDLAAAGQVAIHTGDAFRVDASGDAEWLALLDIHVVKDTLVIGWTREHVRMKHHNPITIRIAMPRLDGVTLSGAGTITADRVAGPDFAAALRGAGTIDLPAMRVERARFDMGGAGKINAAGSAGSVDAHVRGFGSVEIAGLAARAGKFDMGGTGSIRARVDGPADIAMTGVGSIDVLGQPRCTVHKSGLGSVHCGG